MKKGQPKKRPGAHPPLHKTMQIREVDHIDKDGVPQLTDRAVEEGREWVEFTKL
ncbi:MAG: hypothetical protein IJC93_04320 [Clostridia bacterium]|nr:hypothetical protein [Clostridia bacterium]